MKLFIKSKKFLFFAYLILIPLFGILLSEEKKNTTIEAEHKVDPGTSHKVEHKANPDRIHATENHAKDKTDDHSASGKKLEPYVPFSIASLRPMDKYSLVYEHRLTFRMGLGFGKLSPAILNETGPAWFTNSIFRQASEPGAPLAIPYKTTKDLDVTSQYRDINYGYKNKFDVQWAEDRTLGVFGRDNPASSNFISPRSGSYWASTFEGNRLIRFEGLNQHLRFSYTHPLGKLIYIGPSLNFHRYTEKNNISYGSYSTSRPEAPVPNKSTWSVGGDAIAEYSMKGILPGILLKVKVREWWEIRARYELLDRKGNFSVIGSQIIQESIAGGASGISGVVPAYGGQVRDKGSIFTVESSFRYCRFSLDIGMIRYDVKRTYPLYLGDTIGSVNRLDYSARSVMVGFSEMSNTTKHTVNEFYISPGVSFFYDSDGVY